MCRTKVKAEIQSLSSFDFQYLTNVFLCVRVVVVARAVETDALRAVHWL